MACVCKPNTGALRQADSWSCWLASIDEFRVQRNTLSQKLSWREIRKTTNINLSSLHTHTHTHAWDLRAQVHIPVQACAYTTDTLGNKCRTSTQLWRASLKCWGVSSSSPLSPKGAETFLKMTSNALSLLKINIFFVHNKSCAFKLSRSFPCFSVFK